MQKPITIRSIAIEKQNYIERKRQVRLKTRALKKFSRKLSTPEHLKIEKTTAYEIDPVEFSRAFRPFREDMDLLSEDDQHNFQKLLRGYLLGKVDHEMWRRAVNALSELKRAHIPPLPKNYWKRCV